MTNTQSLQQLILWAEKQLTNWSSKYSGYPQNDEYIEQSQNTINGAKKLLEELTKEN